LILRSFPPHAKDNPGIHGDYPIRFDTTAMEVTCTDASGMIDGTSITTARIPFDERYPRLEAMFARQFAADAKGLAGAWVQATAGVLPAVDKTARAWGEPAQLVTRWVPAPAPSAEKSLCVLGLVGSRCVVLAGTTRHGTTPDDHAARQDMNTRTDTWTAQLRAWDTETTTSDDQDTL